MTGYFTFALHTHMPYVRKNGVFPVGEDWLYQVMSDTYIPLLDMLWRLADEGIERCLALTFTPVLTEQLADRHVQRSFIEYLKTMAKHAANDIQDFVYFNDPAREAQAVSYREQYEKKLDIFLSIDCDIVGAFADLERKGIIETIASCATHAFLPAQPDFRAVENQVRVGLESHHRRFNTDPAGFWIPECAYMRGLETLLEAEGVKYALFDPSSLHGLPSTFPYLVGHSKLSAIARSGRAHTRVWDEHTGYPTNASYLDTIKYYLGSGLHYWSVTGQDVPIEEKSIYQPRSAMICALEDSSDFIREISQEISEAQEPPSAEGGKGSYRNTLPPSPVVLASYDTELFGHGWAEGIYWLEITLRSLSLSDNVRLTVPADYLDENMPSASIELYETTWGTNNDDSTWVNPETKAMWDDLVKAQQKLYELLSSFAGSDDPLTVRTLAQAAREVMLLESSDWPYMVAKDRARTYAIERFGAHLERFRDISKTLEQGTLEQGGNLLAEIEEKDKLFVQLDLGIISGRKDISGREGS